MSLVIVDLQGFKLVEDNEFICKEIAVINIKTDECVSKIFKPPFLWSALSNKNKKNVQWLTKYVHGLEWCSGDVSYDNLMTTIQELLSISEINKIYVKGLEKLKWLERFVCKKIINLEDFDCPKLSKLCEPVQADYNNSLNFINHDGVHNAKVLAKWFKTRFNTFNALQTFKNHGGIMNFMYEEEIMLLPMEFVMIYAEKQIDFLWHKFPDTWKIDKKFQRYRICLEHYNHQHSPNQDETITFAPRRKDCVKCNKNE